VWTTATASTLSDKLPSIVMTLVPPVWPQRILVEPRSYATVSSETSHDSQKMIGASYEESLLMLFGPIQDYVILEKFSHLRAPVATSMNTQNIYFGIALTSPPSKRGIRNS